MNLIERVAVVTLLVIDRSWVQILSGAELFLISFFLHLYLALKLGAKLQIFHERY